jgi:hypothetical protein
MKRYAAFLLLLPFVFTLQCAPDFFFDDGGGDPEVSTVTLVGRVLYEDGTGASGVTIYASVTGGAGCGGSYSASTVTDNSGRYVFRDSSGYFYDGVEVFISPGGTASGCPDRCLFEPSGLVVSVYAPSTTAPDILAFPPASVGGVVTLGDGMTPVSGIRVDLGGRSWGSTVTDGGGAYLFFDLYGGAYTVTPVSEDYLFDPPFREVTLNPGDQALADFTGTQTTFSLSGTVRRDGTGVENALLHLPGTLESFASSSPDGTYRFSHLPPGGYTITPEDPGLVFTPPSRDVALDGYDLTGLDFDASLP